MVTGELVTFGILVVLVVVVALVGRRIQTVQPAPGGSASGGTPNRRTERQNAEGEPSLRNDRCSRGQLDARSSAQELTICYGVNLRARWLPCIGIAHVRAAATARFAK